MAPNNKRRLQAVKATLSLEQTFTFVFLTCKNTSKNWPRDKGIAFECVRSIIFIIFWYFLFTVVSRALDIGLIVDASANVAGKRLIRIRNFLKQIVASFTVSTSFTRFGMVEFSNYPRKLFDFNRFPNQATLINALGHVPYMGGQAMLGKALKYSAVKLFSRSPRKKVAIVVTGKSLDSVAGPARDLRRAGVKVVSVGIGVYSVPQLQQMATNKRSVFATKFKTLNNIVRAIKQKASKGMFSTSVLLH